MQPLITAAEARAADVAAVTLGGSWDGLMARAGYGLAAGVLDELRGRTGGVYGRRAVLLAGKGDNGGDAWVAARVLRGRGVACTVVAVHGVDVDTSPHSSRARAAWIDDGGRVVDGIGGIDRVSLRGARAEAAPDVFVDGVLGTGATGSPRGAAGAAVDLLLQRRRSTPVVAADVPTGVDADTGQVDGLAVQADRTVTFGARKRGLALWPGASFAGRVEVVGLGSRWRPGSTWAWAETDDRDAVPVRYGQALGKRGRGRVLVVAGSQRYAGAGALAAAAAVRAGAGLVTLATSGPAAAVRALEPGVMVVPLPAVDPSVDGAGGPAPAAVEVLASLLEEVDVIVLGPGCGYGAGTRSLAEVALAADVNVVLDADGLNVFRDDVDALAAHRGHLVLTPHQRELARLLGESDADAVHAARGRHVPALAERLGAVVLGKGPRSVVAGHGAVRVVSSGGPALGTGGSGDVLAGLIGAELARVSRDDRGPDVTATEVVAEVVHLHGLLGDVAGRRAAGRATARDLLDLLPSVLVELAEGAGER